ncbi:hypothetical protein C2G38_2046461 [Gigaspora rosea]|uniref:Cas12f1-like TNB domain-containing protein n=1 Tax=Gigaspora rosea TaxID=44941 RepID=A0A397UDM0_9GLOM|nr:hypothetical protein C2G38_2046461 [Gigaspora rosea]
MLASYAMEVRNKAYDKICERITKKNPRTIVAYGDGKFSSCSKGHVSGPIKGLYRELKRRLGKRVRLVDEYRTSIICSTCNGRMDKRSRFWSLKVCKNICLVSFQTLWNRDTNAARNIRRLFFYMNFNNGERLEEFRRSQNRGGEELPFTVATSGVSSDA